MGLAGKLPDCPGEYHINEKAKYNRSWVTVGILAAILLRKSKIPNETQIIIEKSDMDFAIDKKEIDIRVSAISSGSIDILKDKYMEQV